MLLGSILKPATQPPFFLEASTIGSNGSLMLAINFSWNITMTLPGLYRLNGIYLLVNIIIRN